MIIYKATNKINGKCYIGKTTKTLNQRKQQHKNEKNNCYFHRALKKYGWNCFEWSIIEKCNKKQIDEMEFHYIKQYKSHIKENGYNMTWGGDNSEIQKKAAKGKIGKKRPEHSKRMMGKNNPIYGKHRSEKTKKKISETKIKTSGKKWLIIYPDKQFIKIKNLANFCRENNLLSSCMMAVAREERKHHKGWKCKKI